MNVGNWTEMCWKKISAWTPQDSGGVCSCCFETQFTLQRVQSELGKPMRNCYSLPGLGFTYGMYMHKRDGGVPEAICHWDSVKAKPRKRVMPPDFVTMGRRAVDEGCTKAREFALYYKYMDIRCKDKNRYGSKIPPGMTFGRPPR
ncbi:hypothetical protein Nmel_017054 [Mimus melanotis]